MKTLLASAKPANSERSNSIFINSPVLTTRQCYEVFLLRSAPTFVKVSTPCQIEFTDGDIANQLITRRYNKMVKENRLKIKALFNAIQSSSIEFNDKDSSEIILSIKNIGRMSPKEITSFIHDHFKKKTDETI